MRASLRLAGLATGTLALSVAAGPAATATPRGATPTVAKSASTDADLVARGEYLSKAAHCDACHSREGGAPYAGNLPMNSQFGVMYSSNITPDTATGIGNWSEKDFEGALRRGISKNGQYLYPAMPYIEFTKVSDDDIHALWAYFRTVKPVNEATRKNEMKFPFNVRLGIAGWQAMYFKQGRYVPDASQSPDWNRGAYLVQGLGHCEACHTPTNVAMAPKKGQALQGNVIDHWFAPDISGGRYSGIKDWSEGQLVTFLKTGHNDKNEAAVGPMQQTIDLGTSHLADGDLNAIAIYLKHQVNGGTADTEPKTKRPVTPAERASGKALYADNCVACHGADGKGVAGVAPALAGASSVAGKSPETAIRAVLQGFAPHGTWGVMPAFAQVFTAGEVSDVVNYVRTSWGNQGAGRADTSVVSHLARYVDLGDAKVESALVCPSALATALDGATLSEVKALADDPKQDAANRLVRDYRVRHPKVGTTDIVTTLSGAYCRNVMAASKGTLAERQQRYAAFTGNIAAAVSVK